MTGSRAPERDERMREMFSQGVTLQRIGDQFGISRQAVQQVLKKRFGVAAMDGGQRVTAATKRAGASKALAARILAKWGVDVATWRALRKDGTIYRYGRQRVNARNRAIPFGLTFSEWYSVWQASGKLSLCGRGKGRYCMSRIRDDGAYELGNVHVQLATQNSRDAVEKWRGKTKTNRGVFNLYPGLSRPWLARVGKERLGFFATEAEAVAAREAHITLHSFTCLA